MAKSLNYFRLVPLICCSFFYSTQNFFWVNLNMAWVTLIISFILIPLLDFLIGDKCEQKFNDAHNICKWIPRIFFFIHFYLLFFFINIADEYSNIQLILVGVSLGTISGATGITIAHELMHRKSLTDRRLSKIIMCSVLYGHFCIEHVRGHHVRVATPSDPATAKKGQNLYSFIIQSICGSFKHACKLESLRLKTLHKKNYSLDNQVISSLLLSFILVFSVIIFYNLDALILLLIQAFWAIILLETTNYIEHYGLLRKRKGTHYEPVQLHHSWNSNYCLSNWILFHLPWHSDHHKNMGKTFGQLKPIECAPQLPYGYPSMIVLAFFPFIFIPMMEKEILKYNN